MVVNISDALYDTPVIFTMVRHASIDLATGSGPAEVRGWSPI